MTRNLDVLLVRRDERVPSQLHLRAPTSDRKVDQSAQVAAVNTASCRRKAGMDTTMPTP